MVHYTLTHDFHLCNQQWLLFGHASSSMDSISLQKRLVTIEAPLKLFIAFAIITHVDINKLRQSLHLSREKVDMFISSMRH